VFFFGAPPGDMRHATGAMPAWIDFREGLYGHGHLDGRGVKIAVDHHGRRIDPDTADRLVDARTAERLRTALGARMRGLAGAPLLEARVCQYENTSNGDFLIDRHPEHDNVWLVGGGSGHGFKHGPFVGEYVADMIAGKRSSEPRFSLGTKATVQLRSVY
jgi:glycine/D-amino acid oxidase-like deaminating enzyme